MCAHVRFPFNGNVTICMHQYGGKIRLFTHLLDVPVNLSHEPCMLSARPRDVWTLLWMLQYQINDDQLNTPCYKISILCTWTVNTIKRGTRIGSFFYLYIILSPFCPSTTLLWKLLNVLIPLFSYFLLCAIVYEVICVLHFSINMNSHLQQKWLWFCFYRLSQGHIYIYIDVALISVIRMVISHYHSIFGDQHNSLHFVR